jgi:hypothetical protein
MTPPVRFTRRSAPLSFAMMTTGVSRESIPVAAALLALEGIEIDGALRHRGVADRVERQLQGGLDAVVRRSAGDLVDRAHGEGAGRGNPEPREDTGLVHADRRVGRDGDEELVLHWLAVGAGEGFGGDLRRGKLERGDVLEVFPCDRDLDAASGLAAHWQGREKARCGQDDELGHRRDDEEES